MPTPSPTLTALQLVTPALPMGSETLSVDSSVLPIVVNADLNTNRVEISIYNTVYILTTFTVVNGQNQFTISIPLVPTVAETIVQIIGRNYNPNANWTALAALAAGFNFVDSNGNVQVVTTAGTTGGSLPTFNPTKGQTTADGTVVWTNLGILQITATIKFNLLFFQSNLALTIAPPSGIQAYKNQSSCKIEWVTPDIAGFVGVRVMLSTDQAGINPAYGQLGDLVSGVSRTENTVITSNTSTAVVGNTTTITTVDTTETTNFSSVDVPLAFINNDTFYALLSTVIQDPGTNALYESVQNGPLLCGFVNLKKVNPTDFPVLQRKEDIAGRLINQIIRQRPDLDLSPRSEIRDLFIDPFAIEISSMGVREWFARVSTSISAITQVDDSTGTGVSDPFTSSSLKQQIARAYGLSANDTQALLDKQFDILAEQAGLTRGGSTTSTVTLTFYTYRQPTQNLTIPEGAIVATVADSNTPSLNFITRGTANIDVANLNSFYNPVQGWWAVTVPAECQTSGSVGNVGAGTIRQAVTGVPNSLNVTNLTTAAFGTDEQSNSSLAAMIQARLVTGVDSGTRHGYLVSALSTPGIIGAQVVAAGDTEMLRDWDEIRQKHVFGTVDIYARGTSFSQQNTILAFAYSNTGIYGTPSSYQSVTLLDPALLKFKISSLSPLYAGVELAVTRTGSTFYLGLTRAQFDNTNGVLILNPTDATYEYTGDGVSKVRIAHTPATNKAAVAALAGSLAGTTFQLFARIQSPVTDTPTLQPVLDVFSVTGNGSTGVVDSSLIELIHTSDFLLDGGSNNAGDIVEVSTTATAPATATITALLANSVPIDSAMSVPLDTNGNPIDVLSVRSTDLSTLYTVGTDYTIVGTEPYRAYGLNVVTSSVAVTNIALTSNVLTVTCNNNFGVGAPITLSGLTAASFLNAQTVTIGTASATQFTATFNHADYVSAPDNGLASGSAIQNNQQVVVSYNKFVVHENLSLITGENLLLHGTLPSTLANAGFVHNVWLPESYGNQTLSYDGAVFNVDGTVNVATSTGLVGALVPHDSRYIKVTFNNGVTDVVMTEGIDYTLAVDATSGAATVSRILTGHIPDGGTVKVSYFTTETFTIATQYPAFVQILANQLVLTKHAAADVLVKAMLANPVDITLAIVLEPNAAAETLDPIIRTVISIVLDNAEGTLFQSELIRQIQAVTGVRNVQLPLIKCAKSDGSYDVGVIIPTGSFWTKLGSDPAFAGINVPNNCWITSTQVLPDNTLPSGGETNAVVDLLYEGQVYRRASSTQDFLNSSLGQPSFYVIGTNDQISSTKAYPAGYEKKVVLLEPAVPTPAQRPYFVTYQVFNEGGAKDITVSSTEYLTTGRVTINYIAAS